MEIIKNSKIANYIKKRFSTLVFLVSALFLLFFVSSLLMGEASKDILLVALIWSIPLFIH